ncbi:MAG: hypothetical protein ACNA71_03085 [Kiritimatiellia bacterium]
MRLMNVTAIMLASMMLLAIPAQAQTAAARGGPIGFVVGCCFGVRTVAQYNEGKDLHLRDWGRIIPYVGVVFAVWDGIEGAQGTTTTSLQATYGAQYF